MAERRMFSKSVVESDTFSEMPLTTQALYFRLGLQADDDGFVNNPKLIQRMVGASEDDLKLLLAKGFLIAFESGVVVVTHWRMQNLIRSDRYKPTRYQNEKKQLFLKDNAYVMQTGSTSGLHTKRIPNGNQMEPQYSIGKDSIDKYIHPIAPQGADVCGESLTVETAQGTEEKAEDHSKTRTEEDFDRFWQAYPRKVGKKAAKRAFNKANVPVETLVSAVQRQKCGKQWKKDNGQYIPNPATWLNQGRWDDETDQADQGGELPWL